jgi:hypothetical protein
VDANVASAKAYSTLYRDFMDAIVLPNEYVKKMYASQFAQHFYTAEEIARFTARWCPGGV